LLGPIEHWFALDRFGKLGELQTQPPAPYISSTLKATAEQWASIERIEAFNRSAALLEQVNGNPLPVEKEAELDAALSRSAATGLSAIDDAITFALYSLTVGPRFDQHPSVAAALTSTRSGQGRLADALESLPEHVWKKYPIHPHSKRSKYDHSQAISQAVRQSVLSRPVGGKEGLHVLQAEGVYVPAFALRSGL
jgi:hypothetical protein